MTGIAQARDNHARAERFAGIGFVVVFLAAVYTAVMLIAAAVQFPQRVYDMLIILVVVGLFFGLLLFVFLLFGEMLPRAFRRGSGR
jgi:hypothetical protein